MKRDTGTMAAVRPFALLVGLLAVLVLMHCAPSHTHASDPAGHRRTVAAAAIGDDHRVPHHDRGHDHGHGCCQAAASAAQSRTSAAASHPEPPLPAGAAVADWPTAAAAGPRSVVVPPPVGGRSALMIWRI